MKYLKKYNESTLSKDEEILNTLKDICVELIDENYIIDVYIVNPGFLQLRISCDKFFKKFNASDILETLLRINSYLKTQGFYIGGFYNMMIADNEDGYLCFNSMPSKFIKDIKSGAIKPLLSTTMNILIKA